MKKYLAALALVLSIPAHAGYFAAQTKTGVKVILHTASMRCKAPLRDIWVVGSTFNFGCYAIANGSIYAVFESGDKRVWPLQAFTYVPTAGADINFGFQAPNTAL